jgi:C4-dicarboxylate transporter DctM subunit
MESAGLAGLLLIGVLLFGLAIGQIIGVALFMAAVVVLLVFYGPGQLEVIPAIAFKSIFNWSFICLPLFVFMGTLLLHSGISSRLFNGLAPVCSYLPGGLLNVNIMFSGVFAAMCGSTTASAAALASVALPEFDKRPQYRRSKVLGGIAAGATLGTTIPPSVILIAYGTLVEESIGMLFIAGIIPGLLEGAAMMAYIMIDSLVRREGRLEQRVPLRVMAKAVLQAWPAVLLIGLALVTIYTGVATPTEAGALGATGAIVIGLAYRELTWQKLAAAARQSIEIAGMYCLIIIGAKIYGFVASSLYIPQMLTTGLVEAGFTPLMVVIMICLLAVGFGMLTSGTMILWVIVPIVYPIVMQIGVPYGWDGLWLGVMTVLLLDQGSLTPPVGSSAFVLAAFAKTGAEHVFKGVFPYLLAIYAVTALLIAFPQLVTWLPSTMMR